VAVINDKLNAARETFERNSEPQAAALFMSLLREAEEKGAIDDDEFLNGLAAIEAYLWKGGSVRSEEKFG